MKNDQCKSQNTEHAERERIGDHNKYDLSERLLEFAARVGRVVDALPGTRMGRHIAGQLVRSGTSPAPNYEEGCSAESRRDFVHKLSICLKELRESRCWLRMVIRTDLLPHERLAVLLDECDQLCRVIAQSIVTAKRNVSKNPHSDNGNDSLLGQPLEIVERHYIEQTLKRVHDNHAEAATILHIDEKTLRNKLQQFESMNSQ